MNAKPQISRHRLWRASFALIGCTLAAIAVAGCGSSAAAGSQPQEGSFAESVLGEIRPPAGAKTVTLSHIPSQLRNPWSGASGTVDRSRLYRAPVGLATATEFMLTHGPANAGSSAAGKETGPGGVTDQSVYYRIGRLPQGISDAEVQIYLVPKGTGSTLMAIYVHVAHQITRTAPERLEAKNFRAVTIKAVPQKALTFTSQAVISQLVGVLSGLSAAPTGALPHALAIRPTTSSSSCRGWRAEPR